MKKVIIITVSIVLLIALIAGGVLLYIVNTPEYALKKIAEDLSKDGIDGLYPHLTENARETLDAISGSEEGGGLGALIGNAIRDKCMSILKSKAQQTEWGLEGVKRGKSKSEVTLSFNYNDKLVGTIEITMIREKGKWKIDGLDFPIFEKISL
jgi:hypothetical protein